MTRILLADDEALVAEVATLHLEALGYAVRPFLEPGLALAELEGDPTGFDLLVTDYAMPGMDGLDLAHAVREVCPDLPMIFMTGYGEDLAFKLLGLPGRTTILHKPFRRDDLKRALDQVLLA